MILAKSRLPSVSAFDSSLGRSDKIRPRATSAVITKLNAVKEMIFINILVVFHIKNIVYCDIKYLCDLHREQC